MYDHALSDFIKPSDISHIVTEDDMPVDNLFSEKQQRLLTDVLNSSWNPGRPFIAAANVGIFYSIGEPPIVPDMFLSMDVRLPEDLWEKHHRSYFLWEYDKPPEVVVEIISDTYGGEFDKKVRKYSEIGILYYLVFDPRKSAMKDALRIYELSSAGLIPKIDRRLMKINLGVILWEGVFEGKYERWLRWCDNHGNLIPTGFERAETEKHRAEIEKRRADIEKFRADREAVKAEHESLRAENAEKQLLLERQRNERLIEKLRALGISSD